jgi:nucleotide-binding universal stress UspA family protein
MTQVTSSQPRNRYVVVVGVDFSDASAQALQEAQKLAQRSTDAELHLVHVVTSSAPMPLTLSPEPSLGQSPAEKAYLKEFEESGTLLRKWMEPLQKCALRLAVHLRVGKAEREICQVASDVGADIIVVGTQGKKGLERLFLGSVAEGLVRHAPCAVLAHRPRTVPAWEQIEPPCADCVRVRQETNRAKLWCARHSEHHERAHTYHELPESFGMGAQTFR